jgi:hypothetical protein
MRHTQNVFLLEHIYIYIYIYIFMLYRVLSIKENVKCIQYSYNSVNIGLILRDNDDIVCVQQLYHLNLTVPETKSQLYSLPRVYI